MFVIFCHLPYAVFHRHACRILNAVSVVRIQLYILLYELVVIKVEVCLNNSIFVMCSFLGNSPASEF